MGSTFTSYASRKDRALVVFSGSDAAKLLHDICCNTVTGYVRQGGEGTVLVPLHARAAIEAHLVGLGWARG